MYLPYVPFIDHWLLQRVSCLRGSWILSHPVAIPPLDFRATHVDFVGLKAFTCALTAWTNAQVPNGYPSCWMILVQNPWYVSEHSIINNDDDDDYYMMITTWWLLYDDYYMMITIWWLLCNDYHVMIPSVYTSNIQKTSRPVGHPPTQSASNVPRVYCGERLSFSRWNCTILVG